MNEPTVTVRGRTLTQAQIAVDLSRIKGARFGPSKRDYELAGNIFRLLVAQGYADS
jgi:hypothetical protein